MKQSVMLTIASLLLLLFLTFHLADDIVRGFEPGGLSNLVVTGAHLRRLAVRNAGARRTAIGVHHHAPSVALFVGRPRRPHEGEGCRRHQQDRQFQRTLLFRLDADRDRRDRALLRHPLGARTVKPEINEAMNHWIIESMDQWINRSESQA